MFHPIDSLISNISGKQIPQISKWGKHSKSPGEDNRRTKGRETGIGGVWGRWRGEKGREDQADPEVRLKPLRTRVWGWIWHAEDLLHKYLGRAKGRWQQKARRAFRPWCSSNICEGEKEGRRAGQKESLTAASENILAGLMVGPPANVPIKWVPCLACVALPSVVSATD